MKYIKKPVVIEAFQYDGDLKGSDGKYYVPQWAVDAFENKDIFFSDLCYYTKNDIEPSMLFINKPKSYIMVDVGDYIIKDEQGELYSCDENVFKILCEEL